MPNAESVPIWRKAAAGLPTVLSWLLWCETCIWCGSTERMPFPTTQTTVTKQQWSLLQPNTHHWWLIGASAWWLMFTASKFCNNSMIIHYTDKKTKLLWFHDLSGLWRTSIPFLRNGCVVPSFAGHKVMGRIVVVSSGEDQEESYLY